jgi:hypothetical protein
MMLGGKMRGKGAVYIGCRLFVLRAPFPKPQTAEFQGRAGNHMVMLTKTQFLVSFDFKRVGRVQGRENVDDVVGGVTIFVFCYSRVTANVSSAAAVTAVVKLPFRTIVRVVGKFLCQHSSAFLVQEWLKGNEDVDEVCSRLGYYAASKAVSLMTVRDNLSVTYSKVKNSKKDFLTLEYWTDSLS